MGGRQIEILFPLLIRLEGKGEREREKPVNHYLREFGMGSKGERSVGLYKISPQGLE